MVPESKEAPKQTKKDHFEESSCLKETQEPAESIPSDQRQTNLSNKTVHCWIINQRIK